MVVMGTTLSQVTRLWAVIVSLFMEALEMTSSMQVVEITKFTVIIGQPALTVTTATREEEMTRLQVELVMTQSGEVMEMTSSMQAMERTRSTVVMGMIH